ncbi:MAG: amino acid ABC transporter permease [Candidatus Adiutrix sp.]|nr:amino acid ABC transporter permease [Candidatus Adiutrix sp.]
MKPRPPNTRPQLARRNFGPRDLLWLSGLALVLFWFWRHLLNDYAYNWDWSFGPRLLVQVDENGRLSPGILLSGLLLTLKLSLWAAAGALVWGLILALSRLSRSLYMDLLARAMIEGARNIPPLVLIFIFYYFLSDQILPWPTLLTWLKALPPPFQSTLAALAVPVDALPSFVSGAAALAVYEGAYFAEIFRGGINSIDRGQWEASWCLGLSKIQQYRSIILPQVFRRTAPQLAGQFISTLKDSSIVAVISLQELTYSGQQVEAITHQTNEVWLIVAALYFLVNFALSTAFRRLEK